jgi:hypothetical protein
VETDPTGVWEEITPYLSSAIEASMFSIGFPKEVLARVPAEEVIGWISKDAGQRAPMVARLVSMDLSNDNTLASRILGSFGADERVRKVFFSEYISGAWHGAASEHWNRLADALDEVADRTSLPILRRWTGEAVQSLREMARADLQREQEEDLRGR